jgi:hypothetical protein
MDRWRARRHAGRSSNCWFTRLDDKIAMKYTHIHGVLPCQYVTPVRASLSIASAARLAPSRSIRFTSRPPHSSLPAPASWPSRGEGETAARMHAWPTCTTPASLTLTAQRWGRAPSPTRWRASREYAPPCASAGSDRNDGGARSGDALRCPSTGFLSTFQYECVPWSSRLSVCVLSLIYSRCKETGTWVQ